MKSANRKKRLSIIGALNVQNFLAPFVFEGSCTRDVFELYLTKVLIPLLKPEQTVFLDNASFHKGGKIEKLISAAGAKIYYLPSYSPDFNPIEKCWSPIKSKIRKQLTLGKDIYDAAELVLRDIGKH